MDKRDYYEILGVSKSASKDEIKSAFKKAAKKYHPDVSKEENAEAKFKEAQEAYAVLSDDQKRQQYDQYGHSAFSNGSGAGAGGFDFGDFDFSDIFGDIFGSGFGFGGSNRRTSNRPRKGRDTLLRVNISFEEAVFGTKKTININTTDNCEDCHGHGGHGESTCSTCHGSGYVTQEQRTMFGTFRQQGVCPSCSGAGKTYKETCKTCHGEGRVKKNKDIEVNIPAGVDEGHQLRVAGKGEAGINGGPNGDIYFEFVIDKHQIFKREQTDIYLKYPITITDAVLGTKVDVPTLTSKVKLTIPAGSKSGDKHRLKGKGIEDVQGGRKGDMYVILDIITPKSLTKEQKKLFTSLSKTKLDDDPSFKKINKYL